jgi:hypothetical protein
VKLKGGDRPEEAARVTNRGDLEVLEILGRQARQYSGVDIVLAEYRPRLLQPETMEPCSNVHAHHPEAVTAAGLSYP